MKHVPNTLSLVRILVTPVVLFLVFKPGLVTSIWAFGLFVAASISDYLDGKLARHYGVGSRLGQFLDPLADKVLVLGTFVALAIQLPELVPWWAVLILMLRAVAVTGLRVYLERKGRSLVTSSAAKWKTTFQLTFLIGVLLLRVVIQLPDPLGAGADWLLNGWFVQWLLWATVAATVLTGLVYFTSLSESPDA